MIELFHNASEGCSRLVTRQYSTSFASAIRLLHRDLRNHICNIYGFVRFADEIVDSFSQHNRAALLNDFKKETYAAIRDGISLNPILHSFQRTVNEFRIDPDLVGAFYKSMEEDLKRSRHDLASYQEYIYGSAEVVGLMCLHVFCEGNKELYASLSPAARALGAAFQKVNFLRDIKADYAGLSRIYFPGCDFNNFSFEEKRAIERDIRNDFAKAYTGIRKLPLKSRFAVYVAYKYYFSLFRKIERLEPRRVVETRIRVPNYRKLMILMRAGLKNQLRLL